MNLRSVPVCLLSAMLLSLTTFGATASQRSVEIVNETGFTIVEFYGSNTGTQAWEEDILDTGVLASGKSVAIDFDDATGYCVFDFKAVFEDGDILVREGIDVCSLATFVYK